MISSIKSGAFSFLGIILVPVIFIVLEHRTADVVPAAARFVNASGEIVVVTKDSGIFWETLSGHLDRLFKGDWRAELGVGSRCVYLSGSDSLKEMGIDPGESSALSMNGSDALVALPIADKAKFATFLERVSYPASAITLKTDPSNSSTRITAVRSSGMRFCEKSGRDMKLAVGNEFKVSDVTFYAMPGPPRSLLETIECEAIAADGAVKECACELTIKGSKHDCSKPMAYNSESHLISKITSLEGGRRLEILTIGSSGVFAAFSEDGTVVVLSNDEDLLVRSFTKSLDTFGRGFADDALLSSLQVARNTLPDNGAAVVYVRPVFDSKAERLPLVTVTVRLDKDQLELKAKLGLAPTISTAVAQLAETVDPRLSVHSNLSWGEAMLGLKDQHLATLTQALGNYLPNVSDLAKKAVAETYPLLSVLRDYADVKDLSVHFMGVDNGIAQFVIALKAETDSDRSLLISKLQQHFRLERDRQILWSALRQYQKDSDSLPDSLMELQPFVDQSDPNMLDLYSEQYSSEGAFGTFPSKLPTEYDDNFFNSEPYTKSVNDNRVQFLTWPVTENDIQHRYFSEEFRSIRRAESQAALADCLRSSNFKLTTLKNEPPEEKPTEEISSVVEALRECSQDVDKLEWLGADIREVLELRARISQHASAFEKSANAAEWNGAVSGMTAAFGSLVNAVNEIDPAEEAYLPKDPEKRRQILFRFIDKETLLADTGRLWALNSKHISTVLFGTNYEVVPSLFQSAGSARRLPVDERCELEKEICKAYFVTRPQRLVVQALLHPNRDVRAGGEIVQSAVDLDTYGLFEGRVSADGNNFHISMTLRNE